MSRVPNRPKRDRLGANSVRYVILSHFSCLTRIYPQNSWHSQLVRCPCERCNGLLVPEYTARRHRELIHICRYPSDDEEIGSAADLPPLKRTRLTSPSQASSDSRTHDDVDTVRASFTDTIIDPIAHFLQALTTSLQVPHLPIIPPSTSRPVSPLPAYQEHSVSHRPLAIPAPTWRFPSPCDSLYLDRHDSEALPTNLSGNDSSELNAALAACHLPNKDSDKDQEALCVTVSKDMPSDIPEGPLGCSQDVPSPRSSTSVSRATSPPHMPALQASVDLPLRQHYHEFSDESDSNFQFNARRKCPCLQYIYHCAHNFTVYQRTTSLSRLSIASEQRALRGGGQRSCSSVYGCTTSLACHGGVCV